MCLFQVYVTDSVKKDDDGMMWIPELNLFTTDKSVLESGEWINDNIVFAVMKILERQTMTKGIVGWQCTQHSKALSFKAFPPGSQFIQLFHIGNHWVTASNVTCDSDTVRIYDSKRYSKVPSLFLKKQICSLLRPKSKHLFFDTMNVQPQDNGNDCGLFAIAYATELANRHDPTRCHWSTGSLRSHLLSCFEKQSMSQFPVEKERMSNRTRKSIKEDIFCVCRMPNDKDRPMIRCDNCHQWYHKDCESLSTDTSYSSLVWKCSTCTKFVKDNM